MSPECGEMSRETAILSPSLLMFSIVGTAGSTRKRPYARRTGRWWSAPGWCPVTRTCTPWKVRRRRLLKDNTGDRGLTWADSIVDELNKNNTQEDMVMKTKLTVENEQLEMLSLASDKDFHSTASRAQEINVAGIWMQQQYQEVNQVSMEVDILENMSVANAMELDILESRIGAEQIRGADKSKLRGEHRTSDNQDMNIAGSGGVSGGHWPCTRWCIGY